MIAQRVDDRFAQGRTAGNSLPQYLRTADRGREEEIHRKPWTVTKRRSGCHGIFIAGEALLQIIRNFGVAGQHLGYTAAILERSRGQQILGELKKNPFFFNVMLSAADENLCR